MDSLGVGDVARVGLTAASEHTQRPRRRSRYVEHSRSPAAVIDAFLP